MLHFLRIDTNEKIELVELEDGFTFIASAIGATRMINFMDFTDCRIIERFPYLRNCQLIIDNDAYSNFDYKSNVLASLLQGLGENDRHIKGCVLLGNAEESKMSKADQKLHIESLKEVENYLTSILEADRNIGFISALHRCCDRLVTPPKLRRG